MIKTTRQLGRQIGQEFALSESERREMQERFERDRRRLSSQFDYLIIGPAAQTAREGRYTS